MNKKGQFRLGALDGISAILFLFGLYLNQTGQQAGWLLIGIAILKQFSGR